MGCGASKEAPPSENPPQTRPATSSSREDTPSTSQQRGSAQLHEKFGYPPPVPPTTTKDEIFFPEDYGKIDKHASRVPRSELIKSFKDVAFYVTKDCQTDLEKVRAIFKFVTSVDIPGLAESSDDEAPPPGTALDYLLKIHFQMGNHAHFFAQLCRAASLPCLVITGMNKSAAYTLGKPANKEQMAAQWNAVLVDGQWRLVDVYWASTCVVGKKSGDWALVDVDGDVVDPDDEEDADGDIVVASNEFFFLTDPEKLVCTHLPEDPLWQLLAQPWTVQDFEQYVYIRERYWDLHLNMNENSHTSCLYQTVKGEAHLAFGIPPDEASNHQYRYLLFKSRQRGEKATNVPFERFVFYQKKTDSIAYNASFPLAGTFKLDIFGQNTQEHDTFDLVASYLIECPERRANAEPLPDCPEIGWGPGAEAAQAGLVATSHDEAVIETDDGEVEIHFAMSNAKNILQNLKSNQLDEWLLSRHAVIREENGELIIQMRLPKSGEYALKVFADDIGNNGDLPNVCNYLIRCLNANVKGTPYPKLHEGMLGKGLLAEKLGIRAKNQKDGIITTADGNVNAVFECDNPDYELFCEVHHNDMDKGALAKGISTTIEGTETAFDVVLPNPGEYGMNVYARKKGESKLVHVHTYLVRSEQEAGEEVSAPKKQPLVIPMVMSSDEAELRLPGGKDPLVAEIQRKNATEDPNTDNLKAVTDDNEEVFKLKLKEIGEYKMDVYEQKPNGALEHLCTYQIIRHEPLPEEKAQAEQEKLSEEEKEAQRIKKEQERKFRVYREQLKAAIQSQDPGLLAQAIKGCEKAGMSDDDKDLKKAKQLLEFVSMQQELTAAMSSRNSNRLEKAITRAENSSSAKKLNIQLQLAKRILAQLKRIEKLQHAIMQLDQKTIAEIKAYREPPPAVHTVMATTCLLLGDSDKVYRDWDTVKIIIGKTGKEGLKRRIGEFQVDKLAKNIELALKAKRKLEEISLSDVRDVSAGAATFYVWASGMIEEAESQFQQDGGDLEDVKLRPKTAKKKGAK